MVKAKQDAPPRTTANQGDWYVVTRVGKTPHDKAHRLRAQVEDEVKKGYRTTKCGRRGQVIALPLGQVVPCERCEVL